MLLLLLCCMFLTVSVSESIGKFAEQRPLTGIYYGPRYHYPMPKPLPVELPQTDFGKDCDHDHPTINLDKPVLDTPDGPFGTTYHHRKTTDSEKKYIDNGDNFYDGTKDHSSQVYSYFYLVPVEGIKKPLEAEGLDPTDSEKLIQLDSRLLKDGLPTIKDGSNHGYGYGYKIEAHSHVSKGPAPDAPSEPELDEIEDEMEDENGDDEDEGIEETEKEKDNLEASTSSSLFTTTLI